MNDYLVFRLYGPMASWGQAAVGGDRPTARHPSRSAILGFLSAALGIKRSDDKKLKVLHNCVQVAVKQCVPTTVLRDYHTAQVPSYNKKIVYKTRQSELSEAKLNTILSSRDYRCDGLWVVAVRLQNNTDISLEKLQQALLKPVFMLSLGRKSCPLALPLCPKILIGQSLRMALDTQFPAITRSHKEDALWLGATAIVTYFWEGDKTEISGQHVLTTRPCDDPVSRTRWQFQQRAMHQLSVKGGC